MVSSRFRTQATVFFLLVSFISPSFTATHQYVHACQRECPNPQQAPLAIAAVSAADSSVGSHPPLRKKKFEKIKIRGYVTKISSPTVFEVEDYRITRDLNLVLKLDKLEGETAIGFDPHELRIGTEVEVTGDYNKETGELRARSIKVFLDDFKKIKRTALIERRPAGLKKNWAGMGGNVLCRWTANKSRTHDKITIQADKEGEEGLEEKESQRKEVKEKTRVYENGGPGEKSNDEDGEDEDGFRPLTSLDEIGPNVFMTYEGVRREDGVIVATRVEFTRNETEKGEIKLWKKLTPKVKQPDYEKGKPGIIKIPLVGKYKLIPSLEAQEYIQELGEKLIPEYQKRLSPDDPNKIPFSFYLVKAKYANAFAVPNGVIVIFSPMFEVLENEAQLAAVIGHEIAHVTQEHTRRQLNYHKKKLFAMRLGATIIAALGAYQIANIITLIEAAIRNGYSRRLENQADRKGLEYMVAAHYDPREAARVWKMMAKKYGDRPTNVFWSDHDNFTMRRSYLMAELRMNYFDLSYKDLRKNEATFKRVAELVRKATEKRRKSRRRTKK